MRRRPNSGITRLLILLLGLVVLAALALQWGQTAFGPARLGQTTATLSVSLDLTAQAASTLRSSGVEPTRPGGLTATAGPTLIGPATPADAWANALLDRVIPILENYQPSSGGFAWWQGSEASARLMLTELAVYLGPEALTLSGDDPLQIEAPDLSHPGRLAELAAVLPDQAALILTITSTDPARSESRWILSDAEPDLAVRALIVQAAARGIRLRAVYLQNTGGGGELALTGLEAYSAASGAGTGTTPTRQPPSTPPPTAIPTATRALDPTIGQVMADALGPSIEAVLLIPLTVTQTFMERHPWAGPLAWTETGPQINQRPLGVEHAEQLTFYAIDPDGRQAAAARILTAIYTGSTTRLPDQQVIFQGHRMVELVYWLVRLAADHEGQFYVAYDDFGAQQALTLIGFHHYSDPDN